MPICGENPVDPEILGIILHCSDVLAAALMFLPSHASSVYKKNIFT
jgi:hypothetical protein